MHASELCYCGLNQAEEMYTRRGMVTVQFNDGDNTLAGSGKFTYKATISNKLRWKTARKHTSYYYEIVQHNNLLESFKQTK